MVSKFTKLLIKYGLSKSDVYHRIHELGGTFSRSAVEKWADGATPGTKAAHYLAQIFSEKDVYKLMEEKAR